MEAALGIPKPNHKIQVTNTVFDDFNLHPQLPAGGGGGGGWERTANKS